jgi:hypothetical protein
MRRPKVVAYVDSEEREAYIEWIVLHTDPVEVEEISKCAGTPMIINFWSWRSVAKPASSSAATRI